MNVKTKIFLGALTSIDNVNDNDQIHPGHARDLFYTYCTPYNVKLYMFLLPQCIVAVVRAHTHTQVDRKHPSYFFRLTQYSNN